MEFIKSYAYLFCFIACPECKFYIVKDGADESFWKLLTPANCLIAAYVQSI